MSEEGPAAVDLCTVAGSVFGFNVLLACQFPLLCKSGATLGHESHVAARQASTTVTAAQWPSCRAE
eukprot:5222161-Amphidinium_carterae.1